MQLKLDEFRKRVLAGAPKETIGEEKDDGSPWMLHSDEIDAAEPKQSEPPVTNLAEKASKTTADIETLRRKEGVSAQPLQMRQNTSSERRDITRARLTDAVGKMFEEARDFEIRLNELRRLFLEIEKVGQAADELFAPLHSFQLRLSRLAESFAPMHAFQAQLERMAQTFEPMKSLQDQLTQLSDSFREHIARLVHALEPAEKFRDRILLLADTFDQAEKLKAKFSELYSAFRPPQATY